MSLMHACFALAALIAVVVNGQLSPLVVVPGYGTSTLKADISKPQDSCPSDTIQTVLWPVADFAGPENVASCWVNNMKLRLSADKSKTRDVSGVRVSVDGFGSTKSLEVLTVGTTSMPYLKPLVDALVASGYARDKNIVAAPYDFRRSPADQPAFFASLRQLVEKVYSENGNEPVTLLAHSLGNLFTVFFLAQTVDENWKQKHVKQYVAVAPLFGGAVESQLALASGWDQFNLGLPRSAMEKLRDAQRTYSSVQFFRPRRGGWKSSEVVVAAPDKNYTTSDDNVKEMYADLGIKDYEAYRKLADNAFLKKQFNVPIRCLMGTGLPSPSALTYTKFPPNSDPTVKTEDGDGVVTKRSANLCLKYTDSKMDTFDGLNHVSIMTDSASVDKMKTLILGN